MRSRAFCFLALLSLAAHAPPRPLAIRDATVVVAPGQILERASVVLRDGLIADVGTDIPIPPDAEVVDGKGLHVYAGFIDARSTLGLGDTKRAPDAQLRAEGEQPDFQREAPPRMEEANRKGLRPEFHAAAALNVSDADRKKHHAGGFALACSAPAEEFLGGLGALHALGGAAPRNALLRAWTGLHGGFKSYGEGYPTTSMGVLAHLRQALSDARHYATLSAPPGRPRPPLDPALEALQPLLRRELALWIEADTDREILRALALAREFNLKLVVTGGAEAWRVADALKAADVPVVLSLKLPKEPTPSKDPEPEKLLKERERLRDEEIRGAQTLLGAGVPFCFSTQGLKEPAETLAAVRRRIEKGLPADAALAGLTLNAAQLFDVAAAQGTVEKGKAASLTVLTAPFADAKAAVKMVVVDGLRFDVDAKAPDEKKDEKKKDPPPTSDVAVETDADRAPKTRGGDLFVKDATLAGLGKGSVLILGGKIAAVGKDVVADPGVPVVDGAGLFVMPGVVDCHSHIACEGGLNEGSQAITPEVRVADVLNFRDVDLYRNLAGGVTTANILHGSANAIGGQNAVIKLKYGERELLVPGGPRGVKFALGENPKQSNFPGNRGKRFPNTRMGVEAAMRRAFAEAEEYRKRKAEGVRPDLRLEALLDILDGKLLVHCHCYRAEEILMMLDVARDHRLKLATLQHVLEGYRTAPEIAALGVGASTFSDWWAYKIEAHEAIPYNAALMTRAGILTSLNSDYADLARHLPLEAAKAVKYGGLSESEAFALVTINPAKQLGLGDRLGSLDVGKDGDLAVFNGHPFSPYSRCVLTVIEGVVRFDARGAAANASPDWKPAPRRAPGPLPTSGTVVLAGGTIHPVCAPAYAGSLLLRDGKISGGPAPEGAEVVDIRGLHVYPGLISALSSVGLTEIGSVAGTRDEAEIGGVQPDLRVLSAVNPHSELIPVARSTGITSVLAAPQGSVIHGRSALIRLDGRTPRDMAVKDVWGLHVTYPALAGTEEAKDKEEDAKKLKAFREPFEAAKRYAGRPRDLGLEAMQPYLKGERPVVFHANDEKQIRAAVAFAAEFGLKAVVAGGAEAWKVAPLLAEKKVPVILGGAMGTPSEAHDPYDAAYANAGRLSKAGVLFAIASAQEEWHGNTRNLPYNAAWASAYGLPREEALKAVTLYPARILGVEDRLGSLEAGKDADLIVTTGDPLEVLSDLVYVFLRGRAVPLETKHTRLYERFK